MLHLLIVVCSILLVLLLLSETWIFYLAIMNLSARKDTIKGIPKYIAYATILPRGYILDFVLNLFVCFIFMRIPKDLLLTGTLKRYINTDSGWRCKWSCWLCENFLNPFDSSGKHC